MNIDRKQLLLAMARLCINVQDLAKIAKLPPQTVNAAIRGCNVRPATLGKIARALNVDPVDILSSEEVEK